ncbi:MAG TPA: NAD-dependent DNA ligase LigA [Parasegetibacter sp.]
MYTKSEIQELQHHTTAFLKQETPVSPDQIDLLRRILVFHEYRYYIMSDPLISDTEYDKLYKSLEKLEKAHPELISPDSPTQRVAYELTSSFPTVQHLVPMLSLENSYDEIDLLDWHRKNKELTGLEEIEYCIEPKFDGASISLVYEDDHLARGATRGDGVAGDDITVNIKQIRSVPIGAKFSKFGLKQVEVRGEVLLSKKNFAKYNEGLIAQGLLPLANPRNAASGSLRIKDPQEVSRRNLEAFIYHLSYYSEGEAGGAQAPQTHSETLQMLWNLGFRSPVREMKVVKDIESVIRYCREAEAERDNLPYEIDGMVIKVNAYELQEKLGMTSHHPRWAIAFKFKARQATSVLRKVEFQVGRTGSITPVAKIDPVAIGGVTVSSVSLFNEEVVREKDLMINDTVLVERAGDVIPYIVKSMPELRKGSEIPIEFPKNCPACGDELVKPLEEAVWRCTNINCSAQVVERIIHFVSKDAMDIRSLGEANVRRFHALGILNSIPDIYHLDLEKISTLDKFGAKSIKNLKEAIEKSKQQPLHRLIFGLGIRYIGETTAKTLANAVDYLPDFQHFTMEQLLALEDVGPKVAGSIQQFFSNDDNIAMLKKLEEAGLKLHSDRRTMQSGGSLEGLTFLFTGTLSRFKRSEAEEMVEANGGKILSGVSSKLNFLVAGEDAGSKLEKAKKISSIKVISEEEFLQLIGQE